jgi:hypothetical protein
MEDMEAVELFDADVSLIVTYDIWPENTTKNTNYSLNVPGPITCCNYECKYKQDGTLN